MISSEKKLKELSERLRSGNPSLVIETIGLLRNEDPFSGAVRVLAETYDTTENLLVKNKIRDFFNDLKESAARDEVIAEIKKEYSQPTLAMLVSSCWQSGLDYSSYAADLAELFTASESDFTTALECFTVIEESLGNLSRSEKDQIIIMLEKAGNRGLPEKESLFAELISILR